jgi:thiol-disulfide isomerase/thioredoxin
MFKNHISFIALITLFMSVQALGAQKPIQGQTPPNIAIAFADNTAHLQDFKGQVIYLDFWASWCKPCLRSFPWMNEMQQKYGATGFKIIAVNLDTDPALAAQFLRRVPANFPIAYDTSGQTAKTYQLLGMPSSYLIDKKGNLRAIHQGFFIKKQSQYEQEIVALLAEKEK